LAHRVHFWLGKTSSQDERGTAAYKTVELDDLLEPHAVQMRETQGHESKELLDIFKTIKIMSGGVASGFHHARPTEYKNKLFKVDGVKAKFVRVDEVTAERASLNQMDVFVLDAGLDIWQWNGATSSIWEKRKADEVVEGLISERSGRPKKTILEAADDDAKFWSFLGGKGAIAAGTPKPEAKAGSDNWSPDATKSLYKVVVAAGAKEATFPVVKASGTKINWTDFTSDSVFILHLEDESRRHHVYVWVGSMTSKSHTRLAMVFGEEFATKAGLSDFGVVRIVEGGHGDTFFEKAVEGAAGAARTTPAPAKSSAPAKA